MNFALNVAKWAEKTGEGMAKANGDIILSLFESVIMDTPVLEGRLIGNWIATEGSPADAASPLPPDPGGRNTVDRATNFVKSVDLEDNFSIYLTNNLPYAHRIEYDGWSKIKAPAGMLRKNLIRINSIISS